MNKNTPLAHHYICPIGADGIHNEIRWYSNLGNLTPKEFINQ